MPDEYKEKFSETWLCPYCSQSGEQPEDCEIERDRIPTHLMYNHDWATSLTWKYIYERLSAVGGV